MHDAFSVFVTDDFYAAKERAIGFAAALSATGLGNVRCVHSFASTRKELLCQNFPNILL